MANDTNARLLVVDDDRDIANALATYARSKGYDVFVAHDGLAAVKLGEEKRPDVILLDISLPDLDGRDVLAKLNRSGAAKNAVVIFLTARDGQSDRLVGLELGAADYEVKPFVLSLLFQKVRRLLEKKRQGEI